MSQRPMSIMFPQVISIENMGLIRVPYSSASLFSLFIYLGSVLLRTTNDEINFFRAHNNFVAIKFFFSKDNFLAISSYFILFH